MGLEISIKETKKDIYLVTLIGDLDNVTSGNLEKEIMPILPKATGIVFDLSGLNYISSMGLRILAIVKKTMSGMTGTVLLVNPQPQIKAVLETVKFLSDDLLATLQEADELLDAFLDKVQKGKIKPHQVQE
jgi:sigma-B regulation protein RsbU (phosphoserine phosphatase)